jgi:hypothetical protein
VALTLWGTVSARAGSISLVNLPTSNTDANSGISSLNMYLDAWDFGSGGTTPTINGVAFTHIAAPSPAANTTNKTDINWGGTLTLSTGPGTTNNLGNANSSSQGSLSSQVQSGSGMFTLLTDLMYETGPVDKSGQDYLDMDFGGLTTGNQYSLRIYYRYWGNTAGRLVNFTFDGDGVNASQQIDEDAGGAHYIEYDFTASSSDVTANLLDADTTLGNESPMIYGATLQVVPEPTVASVLAVGGLVLGLCFWRRAARRTANT